MLFGFPNMPELAKSDQWQTFQENQVGSGEDDEIDLFPKPA
jgi:hypothetical protein